VLNLAGTFGFGLSAGSREWRARLDAFDVLVLAVTVGLAGGIIRELLIGIPPPDPTPPPRGLLGWLRSLRRRK
jgi:uncharacterized membrane protein YeiH